MGGKAGPPADLGDRIMNQARTDGLRSIELSVRDLQKSAEFYRKAWALEDVAAEGDSIHLRATGTDHHVVTLRERPKAGLLGVHFSAPDRATVDALHGQAKVLGAKVAGDPRPLPASEGGGYGFRMSTPEGHPLCISSDVIRHTTAIDDRTRPTKLTHVVLNSADVPNFLPRRAWLQVERQHPDDGLHPLLLRPSQHRVSARQRAIAQPHGLRDARHRQPDARDWTATQERLRYRLGCWPAWSRRQCVLVLH